MKQASQELIIMQTLLQNIVKMQDDQAIQIKVLSTKIVQLEQQIELLTTYINPEGA